VRCYVACRLISDDMTAMSIQSLVSQLTAGSQWLDEHLSLTPPTASSDWLRSHARSSSADIRSSMARCQRLRSDSDQSSKIGLRVLRFCHISKKTRFYELTFQKNVKVFSIGLVLNPSMIEMISQH